MIQTRVMVFILFVLNCLSLIKFSNCFGGTYVHSFKLNNLFVFEIECPNNVVDVGYYYPDNVDSCSALVAHLYNQNTQTSIKSFCMSYQNFKLKCCFTCESKIFLFLLAKEKEITFTIYFSLF